MSTGLRRAALFAAALALSACGDPGEPVQVVVPSGATLATVIDTLEARGLVGWPRLFGGYARLRGKADDLKAGEYTLDADASWGEILRALGEGRVATVPLTVPEGFRLTQIAPRIAEVTGLSEDSVLARLLDDSAHAELGVPGPGLEGYLFPDTYHFARGVSVEEVVGTMVARYRAFWTDARRARLDSASMDERAIVTLASIVQSEARVDDEMELISSVYHNRLERGWRLEADPTVLYALGGWRPRLLYAAMDSVAENPYNTYTHTGLPPGPIGSPGERALDAALDPAEAPYMFFVAWPDGSHVFSRTLAEHNRAVAEAARARDANAANSSER